MSLNATWCTCNLFFSHRSCLWRHLTSVGVRRSGDGHWNWAILCCAHKQESSVIKLGWEQTSYNNVLRGCNNTKGTEHVVFNVLNRWNINSELSSWDEWVRVGTFLSALNFLKALLEKYQGFLFVCLFRIRCKVCGEWMHCVTTVL